MACASVGNRVTFQRTSPLAARSKNRSSSGSRALLLITCLAGSVLESWRVFESEIMAKLTSIVVDPGVGRPDVLELMVHCVAVQQWLGGGNGGPDGGVCSALQAALVEGEN